MAFDASEDIDEQEDVAVKLPDGITLGQLLHAWEAGKRDLAERRSLIKEDEEDAKKNGINLKAAKIIVGIENIKNVQDRDSVCIHLLHYLDKRGLSGQGDLFSDAPPQPPIGHNSQAMEAF